MILPKHHENEAQRLASLDSYSILDTLPEKEYDNLTKIAAEICGTPISLISLLDSDRQWFKSHHGLEVSETPKDHAFCAHAINEKDDIFIVQDSRADVRFHDNPLVIGEPKVIFYAGIPLQGDEGLPLGTLCVIDHKPRLLSQSQVESLKALSEQVAMLLQLRKANAQLTKLNQELNEKNGELEQFAYVAAHDLKSPLNNISSTAGLLSDCYGSNLDDDGKTMLSFIDSAAEKLRGLIDGLLEYSKSESVLKERKTEINLDILCTEIEGLFSFDSSLSITLKSALKNICINRAALDQILINLVGNAIKYSDKNDVKIELGITEDNTHYQFHIKDNGPGIDLAQQSKIFQIFKTLGTLDKFGKVGNGIGLATVKKIVEKMGGSIRVESNQNQGCKFIFNVEKNVEHHTNEMAVEY